MKRHNVIGLGIAAVLVIVLIWSVAGAASLAGKNATIEGKVGEVWIQTERANELLPRLEAQLEFTTNAQRDAITQIAQARGAIRAAQVGDPDLQVQASTTTLLALNAVREAYPDFGLPEVQKGLLSETAGSVNRITYARTELNRVQVDYNRARIGSGPIGWLFFDRKTPLGSNADPTTRIEPSGLRPS